jgi:beta-glucosidase
MESDEVVQLYVSETEQRDHRPIKSLKAFQRVHLAKNETKNITLTVPLKQLSYWDTKLKKYVLPQKPITFSIGSSSLDIRLEKKITLP